MAIPALCAYIWKPLPHTHSHLLPVPYLSATYLVPTLWPHTIAVFQIKLTLSYKIRWSLDFTLLGTLHSPGSQVSDLHGIELLFPSLVKHCTTRGYNDVPWSNSEVCWNEPSVQSQGTLCPLGLHGGKKHHFNYPNYLATAAYQLLY